MTNRNEALPRVSNLIRFISEDELDAIPKDILEAAAERGTINHQIIEDNYGKQTDNLISNMFREGLMRIFPGDETQDDPTFEGQLNGSHFTGKPDFRLLGTLVDYKFSNELRPVTALQLILYGMLIEEVRGTGCSINKYYAFHFPKDHGLFIHKVTDRAVPALKEYAEYIIKNHEAIKEGELVKYEALKKWEVLLQDYTLFEPAGTVLTPLTITSEEEAIRAAVLFYHIKEVTDYEKKLKAELKRYMAENFENKIVDITGHGIQLISRKIKLFDNDKKASAKTIYDKALEECQTGTMESLSLKRIKPRNKTKLIK